MLQPQQAVDLRHEMPQVVWRERAHQRQRAQHEPVRLTASRVMVVHENTVAEARLLFERVALTGGSNFRLREASRKLGVVSMAEREAASYAPAGGLPPNG